MTGTQLAAYIRQQTRQDSTTLPDASIIALAVALQEDMVKEIIKINEDYFGIALTRNLVANQRNYQFPTDMLSQMKFLEAKFDGVNWSYLTEADMNGLGITTDEAGIQSAFSTQAQFDIIGGEVYILSGSAIENVTDGLKLWAFIYPPTITAGALAGSDDLSVPLSTTSFGYMPRQLHTLWGDAIVIKWKGSQDKPVHLTESEMNWQNRFQQALNSMKKMNLDRVVEASVPRTDPSGNNLNGQDF